MARKKKGFSDKDNDVSSGPNLLKLKSDGLGMDPDGDGNEIEAPKNIILTEHQARTFYDNISRDHIVRFSEMSKIQGQFFGNRPRNAKKLKEQGLSYLSNVNNGHARIHINRYLSSEYNLIHGVATPVELNVRLLGKAIDKQISKVMAREWKKVYCEWEDFWNELDSMRQDRVIFGSGYLLREFETKAEGTSWKFKTISPDQFRCPLNTQVKKGSLSKFTIDHTMPAQELWDIYNSLPKGKKKKDTKDEDKEFWDRDSLGWLLWRTSSQYTNKGAGSTETDWKNAVLQMQRNLRNYNTSILEYYNDDIDLVSVYIKEWDGKWSHGIIHREYHTPDLIFFHDRQYDELRDFFQAFLFEPGNKSLFSVRGLGYRIFQPVEVQNRLDNITIDQAHLASTVFFRTRKGRGKDAKLPKIVLGAMNDIGEAELVQQLNAANLQASLSVNEYQGKILERNVQFEQMDLSTPDNTYKTLGEIGMAATRDAVITKPQVSYFYRQYQVFLQNTFRLMYSRPKDEYFDEWEENVRYELQDLKLPEEVLTVLFEMPKKKENINRLGLPKWLEVKAVRSTSSGSQVADILASNRLMQIAQFMGTDERYTFLQNATAAMSDPDLVQIYFPDKNRPNVFTDNMQKAIIESALLIQGTEIPVSPNDDHKEEAPVHIQKCEEIIQIWGQGGDVIQADDQLRQLYPHFLAHFMLISQDPLSKALFSQLSEQRGQVENQFRQIQANASNARLAQQRAQEEEQKKMLEQQMRGGENSPEHMKVQIDGYLKELELNDKTQRQNRLENIQTIKANVKSELGSELEVREFVGKEQRKNAETVAEINRKNAIAKAKITTDKVVANGHDTSSTKGGS